MNCRLRFLPLALGWTVLTLLPATRGQNLLTNNPSFEANTAYYTPGWGWPQGAPDALPGWVITLDPTGDGYAGAADNQSPQGLDGTHFGYLYSGTGSSGLLETAPESRAPVAAGATYTLWLLARGDAAGSDALATVSLVWYPNQNNSTTVGTTASLDLQLPARQATTDPLISFHLSAPAPQGAHFAGVRISRPPYDYAPLIFDDVVIMAEPTEVALSVKQAGHHVVLVWPRDLKHALEQNTGVGTGFDQAWQKVNLGVTSVGAFNHASYPMTNNLTVFRLATP
jgi:hypothetical protein